MARAAGALIGVSVASGAGVTGSTSAVEPSDVVSAGAAVRAWVGATALVDVIVAVVATEARDASTDVAVRDRGGADASIGARHAGALVDVKVAVAPQRADGALGDTALNLVPSDEATHAHSVGKTRRAGASVGTKRDQA